LQGLNGLTPRPWMTRPNSEIYIIENMKKIMFEVHEV
jgi:hypothetical protein